MGRGGARRAKRAVGGIEWGIGGCGGVVRLVGGYDVMCVMM